MDKASRKVLFTASAANTQHYRHTNLEISQAQSALLKQRLKLLAHSQEETLWLQGMRIPDSQQLFKQTGSLLDVFIAELPRFMAMLTNKGREMPRAGEAAAARV